MSLDNNPLARGVCSRLDEGVDSISSKVAERLVMAHCDALQKLTKDSISNSIKVKKNNTGVIPEWLGEILPHTGRWVIPAMFMAGVLGFLGYQQYLSYEEENDFDTDIALLTSDLPIDAYLDRGFSTWVENEKIIHNKR